MVSALEGAVGWGVLGCSAVTEQFVAQLATVPGARLRGVASGVRARAEAIAAPCRGAVAYDRPEDLLADEAIQVVYVASAAELHHRHCLMALRAGKAVLCEKPFALNADQAREIVAVARAQGVFCMEAMWMRFNPLVQRLRDQVQAGELGPIAFLRADVGYPAVETRLRAARPGHGALANFGIYGVSLAHFLFGPPAAVQASMKRHPDGLDACVSASLEYPSLIASINASIVATTSNEALVTGEGGRLRLGAPFFDPGYLQQVRHARPTGAAQGSGGAAARLAEKAPFAGLLRGSFLAAVLRGRGAVTTNRPSGHGMRQEAQEVMRCLGAGRTESAVMPLDDSIAVMETMDRIRASWS